MGIDPIRPLAQIDPPAKPVGGTVSPAKPPDTPGIDTAADWHRWLDKDGTRVSESNDATAFVDAKAMYADLARTLVAEADGDSLIYILAWACISDFDLDSKRAKSTLAAILAACAGKQAKVRALVWNNNFFDADCKKTVAAINALKTGAAISDQRTAIVGSHHQKVVGLIKPTDAIAYCGGMDINPDRVKGTIPSGPLHDTHVKVQGQAAIDLARVFVDRWNDHPSNTGPLTLPTMKTTFAYPFVARVGATYPRIDEPTNTTWAGRISTILPVAKGYIPQLTGFRIGDMTDPATGKFKGYSFLPANTGEATALEMILRAIDASRSFIYLEDQYLVSREISRALARKVRNDSVKVVILLCHPDAGIDIEQVWMRHKEFVDDLKAADPSRRNWIVTYLKGAGTGTPYTLSANTYVHSKCWIFDDELAIIGSANCSRRSYTLDTEAVVAVHGVALPGQDKEIDGRTVPWPSFAKEFRIELWSRHLARRRQEMIDPAIGLRLWFAPPSSTRVGIYDESQKADKIGYPNWLVGTIWDRLVDPDGR